MNYAAALKYLDEHASYQKTGRIESPSLRVIKMLCEAMGDPQAVAGWPKMVQVLDIAYVEELLEEPLYPYSVRVDADSTGALTTHWPLLNVSADKHQAYAVQWFSMALALFLIYIWRSSNIGTVLQQRRRSTRDNNQP